MGTNPMRAAGIVLLLMGTLMSARTAQAEPTHSRWSGAVLPTEIDVDGDGMRSTASTGGGTGTLGRYTISSLTELAPWGGNFCAPPNVIELTVTSGSTILRYANGDLQYSRRTGGRVCFDVSPDPLPITGTLDNEITGGTGRFEGATGWFTTTFTSDAVSVDSTGMPVHQGNSGSTVGEIFFAE